MLTIVGMKMPENCEQCRFSVFMKGEVYCIAMKGETTLLNEEIWDIKRPDRCPLVDVYFPVNSSINERR